MYQMFIIITFNTIIKMYMLKNSWTNIQENFKKIYFNY